MYEKLYKFNLGGYTENYIAEYQYSNDELRIVLEEDLGDEVRYEGFFIKENNKWIFDKNNEYNRDFYNRNKFTLHYDTIKAIENYLNTNGDPK